MIIFAICLFSPNNQSSAENEIDISTESKDPYCFNAAGIQYDIAPKLLKAISWVESKHQNEAINWNKNGTFDYCHMQINSWWYPKLGYERWMSIDDPCQCTMVGAEILKGCVEKYGYTWSAVGCYNATTEAKRVKYAKKVFKVLAKSNMYIDNNENNTNDRGE